MCPHPTTQLEPQFCSEQINSTFTIKKKSVFKVKSQSTLSLFWKGDHHFKQTGFQWLFMPCSKALDNKQNPNKKVGEQLTFMSKD